MALPGRLHDATSWIGRSVLGASAGAVPGKDGGYAGEIALPEGADDVIISYVDATGAVVHSEQLGAQSAGTVPFAWNGKDAAGEARSEEHTSELQSLMRISYAVFCLKKKKSKSIMKVKLRQNNMTQTKNNK